MAAVSPFLFSWNDVEARSDLERFYLVRDNLPDENTVRVLEERRGNGRDGFPVRAMWNALIAGIVFQHASVESLIRELSRNPSLLEACGFDILPRYKKPVAELRRNEETGRMEVIWPESGNAYFLVTGSWNFSRFLKSVIELEEYGNMVSGMVRGLRESLMKELPDFGRHLRYSANLSLPDHH